MRGKENQVTNPDTSSLSSATDQGREQSWPELCRNCNSLSREPESWWAQIVADPETVPRVDESALTVRLQGNPWLEVRVRDASLQCRIAPEHLLLSHPGSRMVLRSAGAAGGPDGIRSLEELAAKYRHVRRRVMTHIDRRAAILDRLFLRHSCVLAVDAPLPCGRADMVVLSPGGEAVFFLLRRYAGPDLRLKGRGGLAWRMNELDRWLADAHLAADWTERLIRRSGALATAQVRRYGFRGTITPHARSRLLLVDFDHAQRLEGLARLRGELEDGLDRTPRADDILAIGDPGNITHRLLFSGL